MKSYFTVDVEKDLHTGETKGLTEGLPRLLRILRKNNVKSTFFVVGEIINQHPEIIKSLSNQGHEVGLHGHTHKRFDSLSKIEKEKEINDSIKAYKKTFKAGPKGFRAPQHSIDKETLKLLDKYDFEYDSSVCSRNIMLLRHIFKSNSNKKAIIKNFFGKTKPYKISEKMHEIPRPAFLLALGGFELKVYPKYLIKTILRFHKLFNIPVNFVMHSWDMIDIKESRTSKICSSQEFEEKLDWFIKLAKQNCEFVAIRSSI